jgi:hypothetical protein
MPTVRRASHSRWMLSLVSYVSVSAVLLSVPAYAEENSALLLARTVQSLQSQHGSLAPELLDSLVDLGQFYSARQCEHALDILELALEVSRRSEGLLNAQQLEIYQPLMHCYVELDQPAELARAQHYVTLINESRYGRTDPRLLPALQEAVQRYEEAGLYFSARRAHARALDIASKNARGNDLGLVPWLRGIARAYRLEYAYGLALPDVLDDSYTISRLRSNAGYGGRDFLFDTIGQRALERALVILRRHPEARSDRIDTLLELGDWHWLAGHFRAAKKLYRDAWNEYAANEAETNPLETATPLLYRTRTGFAERHAPPEREGFREFIVDLDYMVTREGEVQAISIIESNAPRAVQYRVVKDLRFMPHRPKFAAGAPVDERGVHYQRRIYARDTQNDE